jgi:hypothetical protein
LSSSAVGTVKAKNSSDSKDDADSASAGCSALCRCGGRRWLGCIGSFDDDDDRTTWTALVGWLISIRTSAGIRRAATSLESADRRRPRTSFGSFLEVGRRPGAMRPAAKDARRSKSALFPRQVKHKHRRCTDGSSVRGAHEMNRRGRPSLSSSSSSSSIDGGDEELDGEARLLECPACRFLSFRTALEGACTGSWLLAAAASRSSTPSSASTPRIGSGDAMKGASGVFVRRAIVDREESNVL